MFMIGTKTYSAGTANSIERKEIFENSPPTARQIQPFKNLTKDASVIDIVSVVGKPDKDIGSGIYIFVYELEDSTEVWIGAAYLDKPPMYIVHVLKDG
jgi:hypothetical protein